VDNKDKLNRLLKNVSFDSEARINVHSGYFDINYRLEFLGEKDMISVGDWVTYDVFDVTILDMDEKLKKISLNTPLIKYYSMKLSLISELIKTNVCSEDKIYSIVNHKNEDFNEFKKNKELNLLIIKMFNLN
jgi:hypothetical protein